jgi:hypothetical protein
MVMYLFEGFWHGTYLAPVYEQTKTLWRSVTEMQSLGSTYAEITIAIGIVLSFIFAKGYRGKGIGEGIRYGFYIGLLLGLSHFALYLALPISMELAVKWLFGWVIEGVLVGITLALTFMAVNSKGSCKPKGMCGTPKEGSCGK